MSSVSFPAMNRERWAGVVFIAVALAIIVLIILTLGSGSSRSLRYTVLFSEGKGLKVGDRVQMSGVDIGEVDHIELNRAGDQVAVRLKITPEHREKVLANSTAYIADPTLPNVSGQKVVEIYNPSAHAPPMKNQQTIRGKDNIFELKSWQLSGQVEQWGKSLVAASEDLRQSAKKFTDDARKAAGNLAGGVTESLKEGVNEAIRNGMGGDAPSTPETAPDASPHAGSDDAPTSPSVGGAKPLLDSTEIAKKLTDFLGELGAQGGRKFGELAEKWKEIQAQIGPMIQELARSGKQFISDQLGAIMAEIERQMRELEKNQPPPAPDENAPVAI